MDTTYLFERHDRKVFAELPNVKLDSARRIVANLANRYDAAFVDIFPVFESSVGSRDASSLLQNELNSGRRDGVHPTREGYHRIATEVYKVLKKRKLLKNHRTIVCFGDSITFGAFMEGAGTSSGETYPAFLTNMLSIK